MSIYCYTYTTWKEERKEGRTEHNTHLVRLGARHREKERERQKWTRGLLGDNAMGGGRKERLYLDVSA